MTVHINLKIYNNIITSTKTSNFPFLLLQVVELISTAVQSEEGVADWDDIDGHFLMLHSCSNTLYYNDVMSMEMPVFDMSDWRRLLPLALRCLQSNNHDLVGLSQFKNSLVDVTANGAVYQFGVYEGASMLYLREIFGNDTQLLGFDSFSGLPTVLNEGDNFWHAGQFSSVDTKAANYKDLQRGLIANLTELLGGNEKVRFIPGYYEEVLKDPAMGKWLPPARYIDIDVDLYTSTVQVLSFMIESGRLRPGTVIGYDDFWSGLCRVQEDFLGWGGTHEGAPPTLLGEMKAHKEIAKKYNIVFKCIAGSCLLPAMGTLAMKGLVNERLSSHQSWGAIFVAVAVNDPHRFESGMLKSKMEYISWAHNNGRCKMMKDCQGDGSCKGIFDIVDDVHSTDERW